MLNKTIPVLDRPHVYIQGESRVLMLSLAPVFARVYLRIVSDRTSKEGFLGMA
jgi:hypothetical protein